MNLSKKIWQAVAFFYIQVYYRSYELNAKNKIQADKLASGVFFWTLWINTLIIFDVPILLNIINPEHKMKVFVISVIFTVITGFLSLNKIENYVKKNLDKLKSQSKPYQRKWRVIVFLYTVGSCFAVYCIDKMIK